MRVEEDASDLDYNEYFIDKRCEELEKVLRENRKYTKYRVTRQHWASDWKLDPYIIQDDGKNLIILEPEIINALDASEFCLYIGVEIKRMECVKDPCWFLLATILLAPALVLTSVEVMIRFASLEIKGAVGIPLAMDLLALLLGIIYYRKRKNKMSMERHIDFVAAQEDSTFLSALQKLAALPNSDVMENGNYRKRLQNIEDAHSKM